jgi:hypothetical protein
MSLGSWPIIRVSVKMTYNVLEWQMAFHASNQFLMNLKDVHMVPKNIFSLGVIFIRQTHTKLGLSVFQNSQMNWLINFSSLWLISWWIDDWGYSNKFKYAWNDDFKNFPWLYLIKGWGCFKSKALWMVWWTRVSLGSKPQTLWLVLIKKMMNWNAREAYLMDESFGNHFHACYHLLLTMSLYQWSPWRFWPCDCSSYKQKMLVTYFCAFS